jgi:hypothetical protein
MVADATGFVADEPLSFCMTCNDQAAGRVTVDDICGSKRFATISNAIVLSKVCLELSQDSLVYPRQAANGRPRNG